MTTLVLDASAYRQLVRDLDPAAARDLGHALLSADRAAGRAPAASPFALWSLLADVAALVTAPATREEQLERGRRGVTDAEQARAARARVALAACVAHCAKAPGAPGAPGAAPFAVAEDADTRLCRALGVAPPPGLAAWNEYLASLASELAVDPTVEATRRIAGPLGHVAERAVEASEDAADEMQDAVLAAYDAAADAWTDDTTDAERQAALAGPAALEALGDPGDETVGEPLVLGVLRRDPLLRAVALGRVARSRRFAATRDAADAEPTLAEAGRVVERFPAGLALGRDLLRRVIAGDVETAGRAARRWLWDLHAAYAVADDEHAVTGSEVLGESLGPAVRGVETVASYRARAGA